MGSKSGVFQTIQQYIRLGPGLHISQAYIFLLYFLLKSSQVSMLCQFQMYSKMTRFSFPDSFPL